MSRRIEKRSIRQRGGLSSPSEHGGLDLDRVMIGQRRRPRAVGQMVGLMWACAAFACTERTDPLVQYTFGDTLVVLNAAPLFRDSASVALVTSYGMLEGPAETQLAAVLTFAVDEDGNIVLYDRGAGVKRFDVAGEFAEWIARQGGGPREVGHTVQLAAHGGDVAIYDLGNARVTVLRQDATVFSLRHSAGMPSYGEDGLMFTADGELWIGINSPLGPEPTTFPRPVFARIDAQGVLVDTVVAPASLGERCPTLSEARYRAGFWEDKRIQWVPKAQWALGPDGALVFGCPSEYEFDLLRPDGHTVRIGREWKPVETHPDEAAWYEAVWQPIPRLPRVRPAYARVVLPGDGRIWVWPVQPSEVRPLDESAAAMTGRQYGWQSGRGGAFDVFEYDGRWIGSVPLPQGVEYSGHPDTRSVVIRGDTLWAVMRDELDVEYVGRFQVTWPRR